MNQQEITLSKDKPLITFALFAYNQEKYIREAIAGAFSQTYSPLQIILSDDCSSDKTFEIMEEEAKKYSDCNGIHKIIINRNPENLGIGGHINKVMTLVDGDLIVVAAGDDISLPERVETIYEVWAQHNFAPASIHSAYYEIDESSARLGLPKGRCINGFSNLDNSLRGLSHVHGATHAWHKNVFSIFGPLRKDLIYEDMVIPTRSMLLGGGVIYIDTPLIEYRISVGVTGTYDQRSHKERLFGVHAQRLLIVHKQQYSDIEKYLGDTPTTKLAMNLVKRQEFLLKFKEQLSNFERINLLLHSLNNSIGGRFLFRVLLVYYAPKLFGLIILLQNTSIGLKNKIRAKFKNK
ncbi:MAG: glycosyltransferase [Methylococcaceae bacterium]|nr:glycosyltransferase [Methylococcaceae bacterium]MDP3902523.1 glycosyltransferase [Methylococcaceae bacterium]